MYVSMTAMTGVAGFLCVRSVKKGKSKKKTLGYGWGGGDDDGLDGSGAGKDRQGQIDINCSGLPSVSLSPDPLFSSAFLTTQADAWYILFFSSALFLPS